MNFNIDGNEKFLPMAMGGSALKNQGHVLGQVLMSGHLYAIISTTRFLLLVDLNSKRVTQLESGREEYYGISWFPDDNELVLSHSLMDNSSLVDISSYAMSEVGIVSKGKFSTSGFLSQPHQIYCATDGRVICTNTGRNAVCAVDLRKPGHFHEAQLSPARWDRLSLTDIYGDHVNSVFQKEDLLYVLAHGHDRGAVLAAFSYPDMQLIELNKVKGRSAMHNIWVTNDGQRISCDSKFGAVVDLTSDEILFETDGPTYTRGLAASEDFVLIGESQISGRADRQSSVGGLWLVDRKTWKPLDYFYLGPYGSVHDVRLANVPDEAHHGHVFKGVSALVQREYGRELSEVRLAQWSKAKRENEAWQKFRIIFGSPLVGAAGVRKAVGDDLCLQLQIRPVTRGRIEFKYSLDDPPGQSHVGVVSYRGEGADSDMDAIILQRTSEAQVQLAVWRHDGETWAEQSKIDVADLPLEGELQLRIESDGVVLSVNNDVVFEEHLAGFAADSVLGIRWLGATIYPLDA